MQFYSPGKLLISGEYAVLEGAEALAIACRLGQRLEVIEAKQRSWSALDVEGKSWFKGVLNDRLEFLESSDGSTARSLSQILQKARQLNPIFWNKPAAVCTQLEFPRDWGLGSSSTLLCNIARWAEVDAFALSDASFGGSGYDIAVGMLGSELLYSKPPAWDSFVWNPPFAEQLFFVHLNRKQNSRESIAKFDPMRCSPEVIQRVSQISRKMATCSDADEFQLLMMEHERILSQVLQQPTIKATQFSDFPYAIKSLGAWGGDFVLAFGDQAAQDYFKNKGYNTVVSFKEMKSS